MTWAIFWYWVWLITKIIFGILLIAFLEIVFQASRGTKYRIVKFGNKFRMQFRFYLWPFWIYTRSYPKYNYNTPLWICRQIDLYFNIIEYKELRKVMNDHEQYMELYNKRKLERETKPIPLDDKTNEIIAILEDEIDD